MARSRDASPRDLILGAAGEDEFPFEGGARAPEGARPSRRGEGTAVADLFPGERVVAANIRLGESLRHRARMLALQRGITAREVYALAIKRYVNEELGGDR